LIKAGSKSTFVSLLIINYEKNYFIKENDDDDEFNKLKKLNIIIGKYLL